MHVYSMKKQNEQMKKKCFTVDTGFYNHKGVWMMTGCGNMQQENGFGIYGEGRGRLVI